MGLLSVQLSTCRLPTTFWLNSIWRDSCSSFMPAGASRVTLTLSKAYCRLKLLSLENLPGEQRLPGDDAVAQLHGITRLHVGKDQRGLVPVRKQRRRARLARGRAQLVVALGHLEPAAIRLARESLDDLQLLRAGAVADGALAQAFRRLGLEHARDAAVGADLAAVLRHHMLLGMYLDAGREVRCLALRFGGQHGPTAQHRHARGNVQDPSLHQTSQACH